LVPRAQERRREEFLSGFTNVAITDLGERARSKRLPCPLTWRDPPLPSQIPGQFRRCLRPADYPINRTPAILASGHLQAASRAHRRKNGSDSIAIFARVRATSPSAMTTASLTGRLLTSFMAYLKKGIGKLERGTSASKRSTGCPVLTRTSLRGDGPPLRGLPRAHRAQTAANDSASPAFFDRWRALRRVVL